jgi:hypothetical protein
LGLGATKRRLAETRAEIELAVTEFERALNAPDGKALRPFILLLRGIAWLELGQDGSAFRDFEGVGWPEFRDFEYVKWRDVSEIFRAMLSRARANLEPGKTSSGSHTSRPGESVNRPTSPKGFLGLAPFGMVDDEARYARGRFIIDVIGAARSRTEKPWEWIDWRALQRAFRRLV